MMKRFLVVFLSAVMCVSCLDDGPMNSQQYSMVATFEYLNDYEMSEQFGKDSLYFDTTQGLGFFWNDLAFMHKVSDDKKEFKGGFILSHLKGKVYSDGDKPSMDVDMFRVNAPADSSRTYTVFMDTSSEMLMPAHDIEFVLDEYGTCVVKGCRVNVPYYVAYAASLNFHDGDALVLKATGYCEDKVTAEASIDLITCEGGVVKIPGNWISFDLSKLGDVQYIEFDVQSPYINVPEVFCMDDFGAKVSIEY